MKAASWIRYTFSIDEFTPVASTPGNRFSVAQDDQLQLLRNRGNKTIQHSNLFVNILILPMPAPVRDQPLDGVSGEVGYTARASFLTHADELPELVFRDSKVD